jgi:hypothetical protein
MSTQLYPRAWNFTVDNLNLSAVDFEFETLSTIKSVPNRCVLTVWDLNPEHRAQLLKRTRPAAVASGFGAVAIGTSGKGTAIPVQIEAGYLNNLSVIFSGDLREVASQREPVDWKTVISGDEGGRSYREARINQSFAKGTPIANVISACAQALGIGLGNVANFTAAAQVTGMGTALAHAWTLSGSVKDELTRLLDSCGLTWSVQKGVLQVLAKGTPLNLGSILLSPSTGLYGSPEASIDSTVSLGNAQQFDPSRPQKTAKPVKPKSQSIIRFKAAIIAGLDPGRTVVIQSAAFSGTYMLTEVRTIGKSWSDDWHRDCVARAVA